MKPETSVIRSICRRSFPSSDFGEARRGIFDVPRLLKLLSEVVGDVAVIVAELLIRFPPISPQSFRLGRTSRRKMRGTKK